MASNNFGEGDIVVFTKLIKNNPGEMMVTGEKRMFSRENSDGRKALMGINCMWFDNDGRVANDTFNFKDIASSSSKKGEEVLKNIMKGGNL